MLWRAVAACAIAWSEGSVHAAEPNWQRVDRCINYAQIEPHVHAVIVELDCSGLRLFTTPESERGSTTSNFAHRTQATVAFNGDFFDKRGNVLGLDMSGGTTWAGSRDTRERSFLACTAANRCVIDPQDHVARPDPGWQIAVGGWQAYANGSFACTHPEQGERCGARNSNLPHPRTAVGLDAKRQRLHVVVVEGRLPDFPGMTLTELGGVFSRLGIQEGVNLDGGGSTTLVIRGRRVNALPANQREERKVAIHLGIRVD